jgi:hypothetical protein
VCTTAWSEISAFIYHNYIHIPSQCISSPCQNQHPLSSENQRKEITTTYFYFLLPLLRLQNMLCFSKPLTILYCPTTYIVNLH